MQLNVENIRQENEGPSADERVEAGSDYNDGLLATALPIMLAAYGFAMLVAVYTFWNGGDTLLSIGVCIFYMLMYFGVPIVMARQRNRHDVRWDGASPDTRSERVAIFGGSIGRREALLQMIIVPIGVAFAFAAFATIWLVLRP